MATGERDRVEDDVVRLRFMGREEDGTELHELRAAHVAEVLSGLVGLSSDFAKAGALGEGPPPEVLVRPAREGSFIVEVVTTMVQNPETVADALTYSGVPTLSTILWWATRHLRAEVKDFDYLEGGKVKVVWSDDTAQEIPRAAWEELNKRDQRRKKQLRQILAPMSDPRVSSLEVSGDDVSDEEDVATEDGEPPERFVLERPDYQLARPEDEVEETQRIFETEARMSAIDFESAERWRVTTSEGTRSATVEDQRFLGNVNRGLALHKTDIFTLRIREDVVTKNGRTRRTWAILEVTDHRKGSDDDDNG